MTRMNLILALSITSLSFSAFARRHRHTGGESLAEHSIDNKVSKDEEIKDEKETCTQSLRRKARLSVLFSPISEISSMGSITPSAALGRAFYLNKQASILKAAHILNNGTEYSERKIARAQNLMDKYYVDLTEKAHPHSRLLKHEVIKTLSEVYANETPELCDKTMEPQRIPFHAHIFKNGKLDNFHAMKAKIPAEREKKSQARKARHSGNKS